MGEAIISLHIGDQSHQTEEHRIYVTYLCIVYFYTLYALPAIN